MSTIQPLHKKFMTFVRELYQTQNPIALHEPKFVGNELAYLKECIDTSFVSSVGKFVDQFEVKMSVLTSSKAAVACMNGTAALHVALLAVGVLPGDEVITQALTFIATANAIRYCQADPLFLDSDAETLGLCPKALERFLKESTTRDALGVLRNKHTKKRIAACMPAHIFGHPAQIEKIVKLCGEYELPVVEDAAEALGSFSGEQHAGTFGRIGVFSFNGNKIVTCGGGGALVTQDVELGKRLKHITTTAKRPHAYEYYHDELGYNYRLPNLNAALACAQLESLPRFLESKRRIAEAYAKFCRDVGLEFVAERSGTRSNHWLNAILLNDRAERDEFLKVTNAHGVMTRPIWTLLNKLPMYQNCYNDGLSVAQNLEDRVVNIPSSAIV